MSPTAWARDSWEIAGRVAYERALDTAYCARGQRSIEVGEDYRIAAMPIVQTQLERAGSSLQRF